MKQPTRPLVLAAALSAAALLSACATPGVDPTPLAQKTPAALGLSNAASMPVAPRWWTTLGDAQLNQLVDLALQEQPSLAVARARVDRARALADLTHAASGPQAALSAEVTRQRYSENGLIPKPIAGR